MKRIRIRMYVEDRQRAASLAAHLAECLWELNEDEAGRTELVIDLDPTEGKPFSHGLQELGQDLVAVGL